MSDHLATLRRLAGCDDFTAVVLAGSRSKGTEVAGDDWDYLAVGAASQPDPGALRLLRHHSLGYTALADTDFGELNLEFVAADRLAAFVARLLDGGPPQVAYLPTRDETRVITRLARGEVRHGELDRESLGRAERRARTALLAYAMSGIYTVGAVTPEPGSLLAAMLKAHVGYVATLALGDELPVGAKSTLRWADQAAVPDEMLAGGERTTAWLEQAVAGRLEGEEMELYERWLEGLGVPAGPGRGRQG